MNWIRFGCFMKHLITKWTIYIDNWYTCTENLVKKYCLHLHQVFIAFHFSYGSHIHTWATKEIWTNITPVNYLNEQLLYSSRVAITEEFEKLWIARHTTAKQNNAMSILTSLGTIMFLCAITWYFCFVENVQTLYRRMKSHMISLFFSYTSDK